MTKHTPGPWLVTPSGDHIYGAMDHSGNSLDASKYVCTVAHNIKERQSLTRPHNARLISAAPELLEALKAAQEEIRLIRMKDCNVVYDPSLQARIIAAISKAEGRQ